MLWVVPFDLIHPAMATTLAGVIPTLFEANAWVLNGRALAFSFPDVLVNRGVPIDNPAFVARTRPLFETLGPSISKDTDALDLEIPNQPYWPRVCLQSEETNRDTCVYFKSRPNRSEAFRFKVWSHFQLAERKLEQLKAFISDWYSEMKKCGAQTETLNLGKLSFFPLTIDMPKHAYRKSGFEVECSSYAPSFWPWIDLYLRIRSDLPTRERISIEFC